MIWWIESARGGVGKSRLCAALARAASSRGLSCIVCDCTGPARTADALLGVADAVALTLADVYAGEAALQDALYEAPGMAGVRYALGSLDEALAPGELGGELTALSEMADVLVVDVPTGFSAFAPASGGARCLLLTGGDPFSLAAADRLRHTGSLRPEVILLSPGSLREERRAAADVEAAFGEAPIAVLRPERRWFHEARVTDAAFDRLAGSLIAGKAPDAP